MAVPEPTKKLLQAYEERAEPELFLSSHFKAGPESYHDTAAVELHVRRNGRRIAIPVQTLSAGARETRSSKWTSKTFEPPVFKEREAITVDDVHRQQFGHTPFESPEFHASLGLRAVTILRDKSDAINRSFELQASQILQTGKVRLVDEENSQVFLLDFEAKDEHFATVQTSWGTQGAKPLTDAWALFLSLKRAGHHSPVRWIFGTAAWENFFGDADVQKLYDIRRANLGEIKPMYPADGMGGVLMGDLLIKNQRVELWQYPGEYDDPVTGEVVPYVGDNSLIMLSPTADLRKVFGNCPRLGQSARTSIRNFPPYFTDPKSGLRVYTKSWTNDDDTAMFVQGEARPLLLPTALDTFGCLTVLAAG